MINHPLRFLANLVLKTMMGNVQGLMLKMPNRPAMGWKPGHPRASQNGKAPERAVRKATPVTRLGILTFQPSAKGGQEGA